MGSRGNGVSVLRQAAGDFPELAVGFGMCAMIVGVFAVQSKAFGSWFPWSLPIRAVLAGAAGQDRITAVAVVGATVAAIIGCWEFVRREIG